MSENIQVAKHFVQQLCLQNLVKVNMYVSIVIIIILVLLLLILCTSILYLKGYVLLLFLNRSFFEL